MSANVPCAARERGRMKMSPHRRAVYLCGITLGLALSLVACRTGSDPPSPERPSGPVQLADLIVRREVTYSCVASGALAECADYSFRFKLFNETSASIAELRGVTLTLGDGPEPALASAAPSCAASPWTIPAHEVSGPIDLVLFYEHGAGQPALLLPCGTPQAQDVWGTFTTAPPGGPATLRLEGTLSDGDLWFAEQTQSILDKAQ